MPQRVAQVGADVHAGQHHVDVRVVEHAECNTVSRGAIYPIRFDSVGKRGAPVRQGAAGRDRVAGRRVLDVGRNDYDIAMLRCRSCKQRETRAENAVIVRDQEAHLAPRLATLIHNPTAGDGRPTGKDLERILADAGFQVRYQSSKGDWKKAVDRAEGLIVVAGGDGTVAKVFRRVCGRDVPVAVLAMGTANNIARSLGLLGDVSALVANWDLDHPRPFDVCMATSLKSKRREVPFVEACGGGLFVTAIERGPDEVEEPGKLVGGELDRALTSLLRIVDEARPAKWRVEIDGKDYSGSYIAVEAMNIRLTGPGIPLASDADPGDGLLDVALVRHGDRGPLRDYIERRLAHQEHVPPEVEVVRGRRIVMEPSGPRVRIDDGLVKVRLPLELTVLEGSVRYVSAPETPKRAARKTAAVISTAKATK